MYPTIEIFGLHAPMYGILEIVALIVLCFGGIFVMTKANLPLFDGMVLGAYGVLGAYVGSKALYMIQHQAHIQVSSEEDILRLMQSGGAAYGGILVGILFCILGAWIHKIDYQKYIRESVYLLPLCHGIWKIGCHCAGCCYGIPYCGNGSIVFGAKSSAPTGQSLFPIQIVETIMLFLLAICLFINRQRTLNTYLLSYSVLRFFIEFLRNAETKNMFWIFSDIQYMCIIVTIYICIKSKVKEKAI